MITMDPIRVSAGYETPNAPASGKKTTSQIKIVIIG